MTQEEELLKKRVLELANKAFERGVYTRTGFLGMAELALVASMKRELTHVPFTLFGGAQGCERQLLRFGDASLCGFEEPSPVCALEIRPCSDKFAEQLTHRDYLGALMNLGIERSALGDILILGNRAYVFCIAQMADFICESLTQVRRTSVVCSVSAEPPALAAAETHELTVQVSSARTDAVISRAYSLSRDESVALFREKRVFINGALCENNSRALRENDAVSVRGAGRFKYIGVAGISKKGKLNLKLLIYGK